MLWALWHVLSTTTFHTWAWCSFDANDILQSNTRHRLLGGFFWTLDLGKTCHRRFMANHRLVLFLIFNQFALAKKIQGLSSCRHSWHSERRYIETETCKILGWEQFPEEVQIFRYIVVECSCFVEINEVEMDLSDIVGKGKVEQMFPDNFWTSVNFWFLFLSHRYHHKITLERSCQHLWICYVILGVRYSLQVKWKAKVVQHSRWLRFAVGF